MRHILNDCSAVALCDETHYMGHVMRAVGMRQHFRRFAPLTNDANVWQLVDYIGSEKFEHYSRIRGLDWQWKWFARSIASNDMARELLASDRSEAGVFDAFMKIYANDRGAEVRGDKTPIHFRWAEELLEWYPEARIVHMIRDPRAVHVSDVKRRREQQSRAPAYRLLRRLGPFFEVAMLLETTILWRDSESRARNMSRRYPDRYFVIRFEDLVDSPGAIVPDVCAKLGIPFEERMLERTVVSAGFRRGQKGFDRPAAGRWTEHISGWAKRWYEWYFGEALRAHGYPR